MRSTSKYLTATALSFAVLVGAACSDDDDASSKDDDVTTEACDAYVALGASLSGDPSQAGSAIETFESTAPEGLADEAATVASTFSGMAEGEDADMFSDPEFVKASAAVADAYFAGCDLSAELDVDGVDYGFEGIPDELDAGRVGIRFTNATEHDEAHEMILFRRADGVTDSIEDLLALPEDEAMSKLEMAGVVFADAAGTEATTMLDLEEGSYIAICFIPVGGGEDGPPHFTEGMVAEFDVA